MAGAGSRCDVRKRVPPLATDGYRLGHAVICLQHEAFGAVLAEVTFVVLSDNEEGVEDVFGFLPIEPVHM